MTVMLMMLLAAAISTFVNHNRGTSTDSAMIPRTVFQASMTALDAAGRLPLNGDVAGELNNAYQFLSHPGTPAALGCGDQAQFVYAQLEQVKGWRFEMRYEYGLKSPILLPHQWITGYGPKGQTVEIDPWAGTFIAE